MDLSFFSALVPMNWGFLSPEIVSVLGSLVAGVQEAFLPENIMGTLLILLGIAVLVALMFPILRVLLRLCTKMWQAVLLIIVLIWVGTIITNAMTYAATITGLLCSLDIGISADLMGQIAIIAGVLVAYFTAPKRIRTF